jgi:hypothetical protein
MKKGRSDSDHWRKKVFLRITHTATNPKYQEEFTGPKSLAKLKSVSKSVVQSNVSLQDKTTKLILRSSLDTEALKYAVIYRQLLEIS